MWGWTEVARNRVLAACDINDVETSGYSTHNIIDSMVFLEFILRNMGVRNEWLVHYFLLYISLTEGTKICDFQLMHHMLI
jgi:hypothetical protein